MFIVRLHQTIKKQAENIAKIAENYQNERARLIQKNDYEMRSIRQNNKELLERVLVCEGAKGSIEKALKQAESVGPMLKSFREQLEKRPEVKEAKTNKKVAELKSEILGALEKCKNHDKEIAALKNNSGNSDLEAENKALKAENEAAKAKVEHLIQVTGDIEKAVQSGSIQQGSSQKTFSIAEWYQNNNKKVEASPKVEKVEKVEDKPDGAKLAAEYAAKEAASAKVEMTMDSDSESEEEEEEKKPAVQAPKTQKAKVIIPTDDSKPDGKQLAAEYAAKEAASSKVEMTMDSDSESEEEEEEKPKPAPKTQPAKVIIPTDNSKPDGKQLAAEYAAKEAASSKVEMTMDSDSDSESEEEDAVVVNKNSKSITRLKNK